MSIDNTTDIIVLGSSPTALYVAREASKCGAKLALADFDRGCAFGSRHASVKQVLDIGDLGRWLDSVSRPEKRGLIIPSSDVFIEAVMASVRESAKRFQVFGSYYGVSADLLDKARFHALCRQHGVETPGVWLVSGRDALLALADQVPYPCILKPELIHRAKGFLRGKKVLLANNRDEFLVHVHGIPDDSGGWLVQEVIPGPESNITLFGAYVARDGVVRQSFTGRKLRQYPAGFGSASLVTSEPCPQTHELAISFLRAIGFQGICGAEFKRDPRDGRLKIIEINPRPTLWFQITHDAGLRIVEAAWRDMTGRAPLPETGQRTDVTWRYLLKDLASTLFYHRARQRFVFPAPDTSGARGSRRHSYPVFSFDDPLPALAEPLGFARKAWSRR